MVDTDKSTTAVAEESTGNTVLVEKAKAEIAEESTASVLSMDLSQFTLERLAAMNDKEREEAKEAITKAIKELKEALKTFLAYEKANGISKWGKVMTYISSVEKYLRIGVYAYFAYLIYTKFIK